LIESADIGLSLFYVYHVQSVMWIEQFDSSLHVVVTISCIDFFVVLH